MEPEGSLPCSQDPPLVPILSQINPIHTIPSYLSKIHFNIKSTHDYNPRVLNIIRKHESCSNFLYRNPFREAALKPLTELSNDTEATER
jgi:hypothetical protein